jgi:hypothetical protein
VRADFPVVLDACVLIPMPLADTLLRLAGGPRLFLPKWTDQILLTISYPPNDSRLAPVAAHINGLATIV